MTTARDVEAAMNLVEVDEEELLRACGATNADLESLHRKLKELQALPEPPNVPMSHLFTPAERRLLIATAAQWEALKIRTRMPKVSDEKQ